MAGTRNNIFKKTRLLSNEENERIKSLLGARQECLAMTVAQVFLTDNGRERVLCFIKDHTTKSFFFNLFCSNTFNLIWKENLNKDLGYISKNDLHTFKGQEFDIVIKFKNFTEGKFFVGQVRSKFILMDVFGARQAETDQKKKHEKQKKTKIDNKNNVKQITFGDPTLFKHVTHISSIYLDKQDIVDVFLKAGIEKEQFNSRITRSLLEAAIETEKDSYKDSNVQVAELKLPEREKQKKRRAPPPPPRQSSRLSTENPVPISEQCSEQIHADMMQQHNTVTVLKEHVRFNETDEQEKHKFVGLKNSSENIQEAKPKHDSVNSSELRFEESGKEIRKSNIIAAPLQKHLEQGNIPIPPPMQSDLDEKCKNINKLEKIRTASEISIPEPPAMHNFIEYSTDTNSNVHIEGKPVAIGVDAILEQSSRLKPVGELKQRPREMEARIDNLASIIRDVILKMRPAIETEDDFDDGEEYDWD